MPNKNRCNSITKNLKLFFRAPSMLLQATIESPLKALTFLLSAQIITARAEAISLSDLGVKPADTNHYEPSPPPMAVQQQRKLDGYGASSRIIGNNHAEKSTLTLRHDSTNTHTRAHYSHQNNNNGYTVDRMGGSFSYSDDNARAELHYSRTKDNCGNTEDSVGGSFTQKF